MVSFDRMAMFFYMLVSMNHGAGEKVMQLHAGQGAQSVGGRMRMTRDFSAPDMPGAPTTPPSSASDLQASPPYSPPAGDECTPLNALDPCHFVRHSGRCPYNKLDYLAFHFCTVIAEYHLPPWASLLVLGPWVLFLSCGIVQAADLFFAPSVAVFAGSLRLSPDVAGATLLAFGNAAPDVFTQIAAIAASSNVDVPLALGQCVGSAVFVLTFCMAGVIYTSPHIMTVRSGPYVRDSLFYLVAVLLTAWSVKDSKFELHESCSLVLWYGAYIASVFQGNKLFPEWLENHDSMLPSKTHASDKDFNLHPADAQLDEEAPEHEAEDSLEWLEDQLTPCNKSLVDVCMWPFTAPVSIMQAMTSPPMKVRTMSKLHACFMAAFAPPFTYFVFFLQVNAVSNLDYAFMSISSCSAFGWMLWNFPDEGISPKSSTLLTAIAFVQGIAWMDLCADELVDVLEMLGRVLGLPNAFLGATILAWGTSAGDVTALLALSKSGHGQMAIAGCFAGPICGLLLGTGGSLLYIGMVEGTVKMQVHSNLPAMFGFTITLMTFLTFAVPLIFNFRLTMALGHVLMLMFMCYVVLLSLTGFGILDIDIASLKTFF